MIDENRAVAGNVDTVKLIELPTVTGERPVSVTLMDELGIPRILGDEGNDVLLLRPRDGRYVVSRLQIVDIR